jgi:hypothetical protein
MYSRISSPMTGSGADGRNGSWATALIRLARVPPDPCSGGDAEPAQLDGRSPAGPFADPSPESSGLFFRCLCYLLLEVPVLLHRATPLERGARFAGDNANRLLVKLGLVSLDHRR